MIDQALKNMEPEPANLEIIEYHPIAGCGHTISTYRKDWAPERCIPCFNIRKNTENRRRYMERYGKEMRNRAKKQGIRD
jgi:hypothetical protein